MLKVQNFAKLVIVVQMANLSEQWHTASELFSYDIKNMTEIENQ